jgi:hypothetical protein
MARERLEEALHPLLAQGNVAMADPFSCRPESFNLDESARPPTFVQIRAPTAAGTTPRMIGVVDVGIALVTALGWAAYRLTAN